MTKVGISVNVTSVVTFTSGDPNGGASGEFLLQEDGFRILQEDGFSVLVETNEEDTDLIQLLGRTTVNLQTITGQALYTVPSAKIAIITGIICRSFTANLDQQFTVGFNSPNFNNVSAGTIYDADVNPVMIGNLLMLSISSFVGGTTGDNIVALRAQSHAEGTAADVLTLLMSLANTTAGTMVVDVLGYLVDA